MMGAASCVLGYGAALEAICAVDAAATHHDVVYGGRTVRWRRWGNGEPLVLIHGGQGNWLHWLKNIEALASRHTVWVPDLPGFGESDNVNEDSHDPHRQQRLLDTLEGSLNQLLGQQATIDLAGFSFGGLVAGQLAERRGGVRRLALLGTVGHGGTRRQIADFLNWRVPNRELMLAALRHNLGVFMLHRTESIDALALAVYEAASLHARFRSRAASRSSALIAALQPIRKPVLMLWGEHDVTAIPTQAAEMLTQDRPEREWCIVPDAGHWVQYECHNDVNNLLGRWFDPAQGENT